MHTFGKSPFVLAVHFCHRNRGFYGIYVGDIGGNARMEERGRKKGKKGNQRAVGKEQLTPRVL